MKLSDWKFLTQFKFCFFLSFDVLPNVIAHPASGVSAGGYSPDLATSHHVGAAYKGWRVLRPHFELIWDCRSERHKELIQDFGASNGAANEDDGGLHVFPGVFFSFAFELCVNRWILSPTLLFHQHDVSQSESAWLKPEMWSGLNCVSKAYNKYMNTVQ